MPKVYGYVEHGGADKQDFWDQPIPTPGPAERFEGAPSSGEAADATDGATTLPWGFVGATAIDFAIDGVILGAGFAAGSHTGLLLTLALTVEYLFVGLSLSSALGTSARRRLIVAAPVALSLLTVAGTAVGVWLLTGASVTTLAGVLAFGAVAFMYLATEELLVKAHERGETATGSVLFFIGFLLFMVLTETLS